MGFLMLGGRWKRCEFGLTGGRGVNDTPAGQGLVVQRLAHGAPRLAIVW